MRKTVDRALAAALDLAGRCPSSRTTRSAASSIPNRPVLLKGKIVKLEWVNPARLDPHRDRRRATARRRASSPRVRSARSGWSRAGRRTRCCAAASRKESLQVGTEMVVDGYQARDHSLMRANGRNITFPDGRKLFLGSSGTGAPTDGADPTEGRGRGQGEISRRRAARQGAIAVDRLTMPEPSRYPENPIHRPPRRRRTTASATPARPASAGWSHFVRRPLGTPSAAR